MPENQESSCRITLFGRCDITLDGHSLLADPSSKRTRNAGPAEWLLSLLVIQHDQIVDYGAIEKNLWGRTIVSGQGERCSHATSTLAALSPLWTNQLHDQETKEDRRQLCRCIQLPNNSTQIRPHCVRLRRLLGEDGEELVRLCNPSKTTLRLKIANSVYVDLWHFNASLTTEDAAAMMELIQNFRPETLLEGCDTKWAKEQRAQHQRKYETLVARLAQPAALSPELTRTPEVITLSAKSSGAEGEEEAKFEEFATTTALAERRQPSRYLFPLSSEEVTPNDPLSAVHLPFPVSRLFGRQQEIAELHDLLRQPDIRLMTLTGLGGWGKTRLALEAARASANNFEAINLSQFRNVSEPSAFFGTIAKALDLSSVPIADAEQLVVAFLEKKRVLLLMDNFEYLAASGGVNVQRLLEHLPQLTCLVTARFPLDVEGEHVYPVHPLSLPEISTKPTQPVEDTFWEAIISNDSVGLFVDRAKAVRPRFALSRNNAWTVAALCRRLEGIPLALELAAAHSAIRTPAQMLQQVSRRFELLVNSQNGDERQMSLRAVLEWSFDLLKSPLQNFFLMLTIFSGDFDLRAAEVICGETLAGDYLEQLQRHTFVIEEEVGVTMRFHLLETLQDFGSERLTQEIEQSLRRNHADYYIALAETAKPHLTGSLQHEWLERLAQERHNFAAALTWLSMNQLTQLALGLGGLLEQLWIIRGDWKEGQEWLMKLLELPQSAQYPLEKSQVLNAIGLIQTRLGHYEDAHKMFQESLDLRREAKDVSSQAASLSNLGDLAMRRREYADAKMYCQESLHLREQVADTGGIARTNNILGIIAHRQGDYMQAQSLYQESLVLRRQLKDDLGTSNVLSDLGLLANERGDYALALRYHQESRSLREGLPDRLGIADSTLNLGLVAQYQEDYPAAIDFYNQSLQLYHQLGNQWGVAACLDNLGIVAFEQKDYDDALELHTQSLAIWREIKDPSGVATALDNMGNAERAQGNLGVAHVYCQEGLSIRRQLGEQQGIALSCYNLSNLSLDEQEYELAYTFLRESLVLRQQMVDKKGVIDCLISFAQLAIALSQTNQAAKILGTTEAYGKKTNYVLPTSTKDSYKRLLTRLHDLLGPEIFMSSWMKGQLLTPEQAIQVNGDNV